MSCSNTRGGCPFELLSSMPARWQRLVYCMVWLGKEEKVCLDGTVWIGSYGLDCMAGSRWVHGDGMVLAWDMGMRVHFHTRAWAGLGLPESVCLSGLSGLSG